MTSCPEVLCGFLHAQLSWFIFYFIFFALRVMAELGDMVRLFLTQFYNSVSTTGYMALEGKLQDD
jgi:hypothetical protein